MFFTARSRRAGNAPLTLPGAHQNIIRVFDSVTAATLIHSLERRPPTSLIIYAKMKIESAALFLALAASATAFAPSGMSAVRSNSVSLNILKDEVEKSELDKALGREVRIIRTKSGGFICRVSAFRATCLIGRCLMNEWRATRLRREGMGVQCKTYYYVVCSFARRSLYFTSI